MAGRVGDQPWQECQARVRKPGCRPLALPTGELTGGAPVSPPANMQGSKSGPAAVPGRSWPRASVSDCGEDRGRRLGCSGQSPRVGRPPPSPRPYPSRFSSTVDTRLSPDGGAWIPVPALPPPPAPGCAYTTVSHRLDPGATWEIRICAGTRQGRRCKHLASVPAGNPAPSARRWRPTRTPALLGLPTRPGLNWPGTLTP